MKWVEFFFLLLRFVSYDKNVNYRRCQEKNFFLKILDKFFKTFFDILNVSVSKERELVTVTHL
jgi:hypothetical protein